MAVQFGPGSAQVQPPLASAHHKYTIIGIVLGVPTKKQLLGKLSCQGEEINGRLGDLEGVLTSLNVGVIICTTTGIDHVWLPCLCFMGACYDWS